MRWMILLSDSDEWQINPRILELFSDLMEKYEIIDDGILVKTSSQKVFLSNEYYMPYPLISFSLYTRHIPNQP